METANQSMKFDVILVSLVNSEQISNIALLFPLMTFKK